MSEDSPEMPPPRIARRGRRNWLWLIVCAHLGLLVMVAMIVVNSSERYHRNEEFVFVLLGLASAQAGLLGIWAALGPDGAVWRLSRALTLLAVLTLAVMAYFRWIEQGSATSLLMVGTAVVGPFLSLSMLTIARLPWRVRIARGHNSEDSTSSAAQFGLRQVMVWMAGMAMFLACFRLLISGPVDLEVVSYLLPQCLLWLWFTAVDTLLLTWLCLLGYRTMFTRIVGGVLVLLLVIMLVIEANNTYWDSFFTLRGAELTLALVTLLALRWAGYRMKRPPKVMNR